MRRQRPTDSTIYKLSVLRIADRVRKLTLKPPNSIYESCARRNFDDLPATSYTICLTTGQESQEAELSFVRGQFSSIQITTSGDMSNFCRDTVSPKTKTVKCIDVLPLIFAV